MQVEQITRRVWSVHGLAEDANAGFVSTGSGVVVFDTGRTPEQGKRLCALIKETVDEPVAFVVNSHFHGSHCGGNDAFSATFLYHRACYDRLREEGRIRAKCPEPQIIFKKDAFIKIGSVSFELCQTCGHAPGSLVLFLPDENVVFAGDLLFIDRNPGSTHSNLRQWANEVSWLASLPVEHFIPGHGPIGSKRDVHRLEQYLDSLLTSATSFKKDDAPIEKIIAMSDFPTLGADPFCPRHRRNVEAALRQVA